MHLRSETALDYVEGRLEKDQETFWRQHLTMCKDCTDEVGTWQEICMALKRPHLTGAPDQDLAKAFLIYPSPSTPIARAEPKLRRLLASVIFDSFESLAFAGTRGTAPARQLVMRAEEFDIHIKIWGEQNQRQMLGQLLPRSGEQFVRNARFHLLRNGERLETTAVDEMGEFRFRDVPEGDLSLQIDLPNLTVIGALKSKTLER